MREIFDRFPEVVMIDATHGTNLSKYKIFSIMSHDAFGKGQFVQHAVIQNERNPTLLTSLEEFKRNNPAWTRIRCILIDKDFGEIEVLMFAFPDAALLLCKFHVLKYLRKELAAKDYGLMPWQKQQLDGLVNMLVYAKTEREYRRIRDYMRHIVTVGNGVAPGGVSNVLESQIAQLGTRIDDLGTSCGDLGIRVEELGTSSGGLGARSGELGADVEDDRAASTHPFEAYFSKNWDNCRHMWCAFERQNACTLGNNTNNRLEASRKQLKELLDSFMHVDECIASIMYYQAQEEREKFDAVYKLSLVRNPKYDSEMEFLTKLVSEHSCELVYEQYNFAISRAKYKFHEAVPDVYLIHCDSNDADGLDEPSSEYSVTKSNWSCSCLFMASRLLPCRHVFYIRKALNFENIIPTHLLNPRWLLASLRSNPDLPQLTGQQLNVARVLQDSNASWDSNRKFREANYVASSISEHSSGLGMREYRAAMKALYDVASLFRHGQYDAISRAAAHEQPSPGSHEDQVCVDEVEVATLEDQNTAQEVTSSADSHSELTESGHGSVSPESSVQSTQLGTESTQLGVVSEQLGTGNGQLGTVSYQLGTESEQLGTGHELSTGGEQLDADQLELGSRDTDGDQPTTLPSIELSEEFEIEIQTPPKSRGRPKQKPKTVKANRKKSVAVVQEDLEMHHSQLNLLTVFEALQGTPIFKSSSEKLLKFNQFIFASKPKPPIVHELTKLLRTKPLMRPEEIVRIFPMDLITKCTAKVTAYQAKHPGTQEMQLAMEILGVGVFAYSTVTLMRRWHVAITAVRKIQTTLDWIQRLDYSRHGNSSFSVEEDSDIPTLVESLPILSSVETEVLDLAAKSTLSAQVMQTVMTKLFGADPNVVVIDPSHVGVENGSISTDRKHFRRALTGVTKEMKVLVPINCNNNHWCAVLMNLSKNRACIYDSMASSYLASVRAVAQTLVMMVPEHARPSSCLATHDPGLGVQTDSYNCGVYVLLA